MNRKPCCHWRTGGFGIIESEVKSRKHPYACGKPAKWEVEWDDGEWFPVCGIHRNTAKRYRLLVRASVEDVDKVLAELKREFGE